jgi:hypothetical protein
MMRLAKLARRASHQLYRRCRCHRAPAKRPQTQQSASGRFPDRTRRLRLATVSAPHAHLGRAVYSFGTPLSVRYRRYEASKRSTEIRTDQYPAHEAVGPAFPLVRHQATARDTALCGALGAPAGVRRLTRHIPTGALLLERCAAQEGEACLVQPSTIAVSSSNFRIWVLHLRNWH